VLNGLMASRVAVRSGTGAFPTAVTVKDVTDTTTYVLGTDYYLGQDGMGYMIVMRKTSGAIADGATVHVNYTVTTATNKTLTSGGKQTIAYVFARVTNLDENGKKLEVTLYKARIKKGIEMAFKADNATEANTMPLEIEGICDLTRAVGAQLFAIVDEQGV